MSKSAKLKTGIDCEIGVLATDELDSVSGGRPEVVIIGCTTPRPMGGYPPGTVTWNPWIGQPYPTQH